MQDKKYLSAETPSIERERGGCLSIWLVFFVIFNGFFLYSYIRLGEWLPAVWGIFGLICAIGVWNWSKWAFYGLLLGFAFNIALSIDGQSVLGVMYNLTFLVFTYFLVYPKREYLR